MGDHLPAGYDPAEWYQRKPGGAWYKIGEHHAHHVKTCEQCGREALMLARNRFCSVSCGDRAKRRTGAAYSARHWRVYRARGKAKDQLCVDCRKQARDWSQIHGTTGLESEHYEPRCRKCHSVYDDHIGTGHARAKLTEADVCEIKRLYASTENWPLRHPDRWTQPKLGVKFGVHSTIIHDIVRGVTWKHVS